MLIAAAVCPHPPLLVPQVAAGAAGELAVLRAACDRAVAALAASGPDVLAVVGAGGRDRDHPAAAGGGFADYGVDLRVGEGEPVLPLSLTVGRWLAERAGVRPDRYAEVDAAAGPGRCLARGAALAEAGRRVALLVMGDGSARNGDAAPAPADPEAPAFHGAVAAALAAADADALARLEPRTAERLLAQGRPAWQVLAGAARALPAGYGARGELLAHEAPYGVGYFVAVWTVAGRAAPPAADGAVGGDRP
ncbi:hypothetical protein ACFPZ0_25030 [Streptomonospora nanhaiensis]|uniref:hypothetical protein n=1 Tax=Streptomonospora nanhaiensis TaxID=1323731 RepID=UPI003612DAD9